MFNPCATKDLAFLLYEFLGEQEIRIREYFTASSVFFIYNKNLIIFFSKKYLYEICALLKISIKNSLNSLNHFLIARNLSYQLYQSINTYKNKIFTEIMIFFPIIRKQVTFSLILIKDAVLFFGKKYGHFSVKFSTKCELFR